MNETIKNRVMQIMNDTVPEGYRKSKVGIIPTDWTVVTVGKCIEECKKLSNDISQYPVYSSSRQGLVPQSEYYNQKTAIETNLGYKIVPDLFVTYRHMSDDDVFYFNVNTTGGNILVSSEYPVFTSSQNTDLGFLIPALNSTARFRYFCRGQKLGGTRTRLYLKNLSSYELAMAPLPEQQKIAKILTTCDKVIEQKEKRITEKQRQKKYLMQQLLTGRKRLAGFEGKWKKVKLSHFLDERGLKKANINLPICSVAVQKGVVDQIEHLGRSYAAQDTSNYNVVKYGDIVYTKSPTGEFPYGIIKQSYKEDAVAVSPLYGVFEPSNFEIGFLLHTYFEYYSNAKKYLTPIVQKGAKNTINISNATFLSNSVTLPLDNKEQKALVNIFKTANREIELLQKDLEQEKLKKKAMMQLLLTGIVRVTP